MHSEHGTLERSNFISLGRKSDLQYGHCFFSMSIQAGIRVGLVRNGTREYVHAINCGYEKSAVDCPCLPTGCPPLSLLLSLVEAPLSGLGTRVVETYELAPLSFFLTHCGADVRPSFLI